MTKTWVFEDSRTQLSTGERRKEKHKKEKEKKTEKKENKHREQNREKTEKKRRKTEKTTEKKNREKSAWQIKRIRGSIVILCNDVFALFKTHESPTLVKAESTCASLMHKLEPCTICA